MEHVSDHVGEDGAALYGAGFRDGQAQSAKLREENDKMRALLAYGSDPCVYCGLTKADMAKCAHGFPGCGRADDMATTDNPWPPST